MSLLVRPQAFSSDIDRVFNTLFNGEQAKGQRWTPAMDLLEADDHYTLKADLPGVSEEAVSIEVSDGVLRLSGERELDQEQSGRGWFRIERSFGTFSRSLTLPDGVDADEISASCDLGVLSVRIPKPTQRQPKRIEIQGSNGASTMVEGSAQERG